MCCCAKPNINGDPGYSWDGKEVGTRPTAPPALWDGDDLLFDEPGRCGGIDSHSHHYRVVKNCGGIALLVRHGGGDDRIPLFLPRGFSLDPMDSNMRYWFLNAIYHGYREGIRSGSAATDREYRQAFLEDRLKKRKLPGRNYHRVWIEPRPEVAG